jgi:hypothetical protein
VTCLVAANVLSEATKPAPSVLVVATRNRRDFEPAGVRTLDPFAA